MPKTKSKLVILTSNSCGVLALCRVLSMSALHYSSQVNKLLLFSPLHNEKAETQGGWKSCLSHTVVLNAKTQTEACVLKHQRQWEWPKMKVGESRGGSEPWVVCYSSLNRPRREPPNNSQFMNEQLENSTHRLLEIAWTFCSPHYLLDRKKYIYVYNSNPA